MADTNQMLTLEHLCERSEHHPLHVLPLRKAGRVRPGSG